MEDEYWNATALVEGFEAPGEPKDDWRTIPRMAWCLLAHGRYRRWTGRRHIGRASITVEVQCVRCGVKDMVTRWYL